MALPVGGGGEGGSQTLNLKLVLEGEDYLQRLVEAIASTDEFQEKVQLLEALIKSVAKESGASFEEVGRSIRKVSGELELFSENTEKALGDAVKNVTEDAKAGFTSVGEAAGGFREQVDLTKKSLQEIAQQKGLSLQDVAEGMKQAGVNTKIVSTALKELNAELRKTAETGKKLTPAQELQRYRTQVEQLKNQIRELAQVQGTTFRDAGQALQATGSPARETAAAVRELNEEAKETPGVLQNIGRVGAFVFGSVLGLTATSALRRVIDFLREAAEVGLEFNRSIFQMQVAVRGLQRVGIDTTMERFEEQVRAVRDEFKIFTERELKQASAALALYTREVGFTEEQIFDLVEISAALASVTGKDVGETGFLIARALASGYTEALQRMGIAISRADITQRAMDLGLNKSFIQLTEQERATVSLSLVYERTAAILDDVNLRLDTLSGRYDQAKTAQRAFTQDVGTKLLPASVRWQEFIATLVEGLLEFDNKVRASEARLEAFLFRIGAVLRAVSESVTTRSLDPLIERLETLDELTERFLQSRLQDLLDFGEDEGLGNVPGAEMGMFARVEDEEESLSDVVESIQKRLEDEQLKGQQRRIDILLNFARRREDIIRASGRKIEEMERQLQSRLLEIAVSFNERLNKMVEDYELRRAQVIRQFEIRSQEQRERRRQQAIDEERKFQEKLLRLQEDFLLNLEDAVRERDALQIIRLTRRFNLEKKQMIREFENRQQEQDEQAEQEQAQLERQKAERLRQLSEEHQLRTRQLLRQQELERASAARDHLRKLQEEKIRFDQRMEDLNLNREQELADLQRAIENRLEQILQGWIQEGKLTQENADAIYDIIAGTFGPGGRVEGVYLYFLSLLQNMAQVTSQITASLPGGTGPFIPGPQVTAFQSGGSLIATRPTTAVFGERPELVTFTPLTGPNTAPRHVGSMPAGMGAGSGQGRLGLEILLSPGLEMRIIDQAMDEMANVELSVNRGSRQ